MRVHGVCGCIVWIYGGVAVADDFGEYWGMRGRKMEEIMLRTPLSK